MIAQPSEDELIARYFAPMAGPAALGLRDDAACLTPPPGCDLVLSVDGLVAGVHFFADDPADAIARKALRVNLSDLAAKGAAPLGFLLTMALPGDWAPAWLEGFAAGLAADADAFACPLLGGDTVKTPGPLTLSITVLGSVPRGRMVPRTGIGAGNLLYVTGTIGDAALGLRLRTGDARLAKVADHLDPDGRAFLLTRYLRPEPRLALAGALRMHATAGMDVSDGLIGDLEKMLGVSGVGATIELARMPLSRAVQSLVEADPRLLAAALTGGDDYEVLAAVPPSAASAFEMDAAAAGIALTRIGIADRMAGATNFIDAEGNPRGFAQTSFSHF